MDPKLDLQWIQEYLLVLQAQEQDHGAFHKLVDRYERRLLYYIRRILGCDERALDVSQEVWLTVFRRIGSLRSPEAFRGWLYKIAHDRAVTFLRRQRRELAVQEEALAYHEPSDPGDEIALLEQAELVHRALDQISPAHCAVLALRFLENMTMEDIACVIGCNLGTTKSRLHYAKQALRRKIEELTHE